MIWLSTALAGFYHPADVAGSSQLYAEASKVSAGRAGDAQREARSLAAALVDFEEATALLGQPSSVRQASLLKQYNRDLAVLQAFVDTQIDGFDQAFKGALTRALAPHSGAVRCLREVPKGRAIPGMGVRMEKNIDCKGDDLNAALAASIDNDAVLMGALKQVNGRIWPSFSLQPAPEPIVGTRWISASRFFQSTMGDSLRSIRRADDEDRSAFYVAIEQGASKKELEGLVAQANAVDHQTALRRTGVAAPALARAAVVLAKKAPDAAWCAQPALLGGCIGSDHTDVLTPLLLADKKLARALP